MSAQDIIGKGVMTAAKNDNKHIVATKGRKGDTKVRDVDGEASHVNAYEAYLIDSYGKGGEELTKLFGSGTTNPETGMPEYYSGGAGKASSIVGSAGSAASGAIAMGATGAALGPIAAAAPWLAVGLLAYDWIAGAGEKAKQSKAKMKKLGEGIANIEGSRLKAAEVVTEDMNNIWEGVGSQLSDIRYGAGETFEDLSKGVNQVVKGGRGLATGTADAMVAETTKDLKDNLSRSTSKLETDAGQQVEKMGQAHGSEMEDMANQIKDMNEQITELEKSDHWSENLW